MTTETEEAIIIKPMMQTGKVKWYDAIKGFGFISSDEGNDLFVHRTSLNSAIRSLVPEQKVKFEIKDGEKGPIAVNVEAL